MVPVPTAYAPSPLIHRRMTVLQVLKLDMRALMATVQPVSKIHSSVEVRFRLRSTRLTSDGGAASAVVVASTNHTRMLASMEAPPCGAVGS